MMIFRNGVSLAFLLLFVSRARASSLQSERISSMKAQVNSRFVQADTSDASMERSLFEMPSTFDFYNSLCRARYDGDEELLPFLNACPQCPEQYASAHCNNCCQGGASSIKMLWHGCAATLSFASTSQAHADCQLHSEIEDTARFVDCDCYNSMTDPSTFDSFECTTYDSITIPPDAYSFEICIVSVVALDFGLGAEAVHAVEFSKPLPDVLGLIHTFDSVDLDLEARMESFATYFDTTCSKDESSPFPSPIFPGYGKFPNTCQDFGFVDLNAGHPSLPEQIEHLTGAPPVEAYWYEFLDGTSVSFWPSLNVNEYFFDPTFAQCSCSQDSGNSVTTSPSEISVQPPSALAAATEIPSAVSDDMDSTTAPTFSVTANEPSPATAAPGFSHTVVTWEPSQPTSQAPTSPRNPGPAISTPHPTGTVAAPTNISSSKPTSTADDGDSLLASKTPSQVPSSFPTGLRHHGPSSRTSLPSKIPTQIPSFSPTGLRNPGPPGTTSLPSTATTQAPSTIPEGSPNAGLPDTTILPSAGPTKGLSSSPSVTPRDTTLLRSKTPAQASTPSPAGIANPDPPSTSSVPSMVPSQAPIFSLASSPAPALLNTTLLLSTAPMQATSSAPADPRNPDALDDTLAPSTAATPAPSSSPVGSNNPALPSSSLLPSMVPTQTASFIQTHAPNHDLDVSPFLLSGEPTISTNSDPSDKMPVPSLTPMQAPSSFPTGPLNSGPASTKLPSTAPTQPPSASPIGPRNPGPPGAIALPSAVPTQDPSLARTSSPLHALLSSTNPSQAASFVPTNSRDSESPVTILPSFVQSETPSSAQTLQFDQQNSAAPNLTPSATLGGPKSGAPTFTKTSSAPSTNPTFSSAGPSLPHSENPSEAYSQNPTFASSTSTRPTILLSSSPTVSTVFPTAVPLIPSAVPTILYSSSPSVTPTEGPSVISALPSSSISSSPTHFRSASPSFVRSAIPTVLLSTVPTENPTELDSTIPSKASERPSSVPSVSPTDLLSASPSLSKNALPTNSNSDVPSSNPTDHSSSPTSGPSSVPITVAPSIDFLSMLPSSGPTAVLNLTGPSGTQCTANDFLDCNNFASNNCRTFSPAFVGNVDRECRYEGQERRSLMEAEDNKEWLLAKLQYHKDQLSLLLEN